MSNGVSRPSGGETLQSRRPATGRFTRYGRWLHDGVYLELHQPLWIDETGYFNEGARRSYLREAFAMCARRLSPTGDVNKHDPGSDDVCQRRTGLVQRLLGDVQATYGLRVHISGSGCGAVVCDRRGAGHGYVRPYPHGA